MKNRFMPKLAIITFAVVSWIIHTTVGGIALFTYRSRVAYADPSATYAEQTSTDVYWLFAVVASAVLIPAIITVTSNAAVSGAAARERTLAILRLLGLDAAAVNRIAIKEVLSEAFIGLVIGTVVSLVTSLAWAALSFDGVPVNTAHMILPWWGYLAVWLVVLAIAAVAAVMGMRRVAITPLSVARKAPPKYLRVWRILFFVVVLVAGDILIKFLDISDNSDFILIVAVVLVLVFAANLAMSFLVGALARIASNLPGLPPVAFVALRRIATRTGEAWARVSTLAWLSVLLGAMSALPIADGSYGPATALLLGDIRTGAFITLGFAFLINAVNTLLTQCAMVYQQQDLDKSLHRIGVRPNFLGAVTALEVLLPLGVATLVGVTVGRVVVSVMADGAAPFTWWIPVAGLALGYGLVLLALVATEVLRRRVAAENAGRRGEAQRHREVTA